MINDWCYYSTKSVAATTELKTKAIKKLLFKFYKQKVRTVTIQNTLKLQVKLTQDKFYCHVRII